MRRLSIGLAALLAAVSTAATAAEFTSVPAPQAAVRLGPPGPPSVVAEEPGLFAKKRTAKFQVTYQGFTNEAETAFQRAVDIWERKLTSSVPIKVLARWQNLGGPTPNGQVLGSAGPFTLLSCSSGCPAGIKKNVAYPIAIINKVEKSDQRPNDPDIVAQFNKQFQAWHFGNGDAPNNKIDFTSVVLHELGHGLGFVGGAATSGNLGSLTAGDQRPPFIYAIFAVDKNDKLLTKYPDPSTQLKNALESKNVFFKIGNKRYELFAPKPFQPGSSFSHLDEKAFPKGNANSLMTPQIGAGETIRDPGPITLSIFDVMGW